MSDLPFKAEMFNLDNTSFPGMISDHGAADIANAPFICEKGGLHEPVSNDQGYWCDKCGRELVLPAMRK